MSQTPRTAVMFGAASVSCQNHLHDPGMLLQVIVVPIMPYLLFEGLTPRSRTVPQTLLIIFDHDDSLQSILNNGLP